MGRGLRGVALRELTRLFESGTLVAAPDRELLDRFASRGDESAFEALLARHGRLVLNVGRKVLRDPVDVEDAFQATFLVLVRKPPRLRGRDSLAPWISTVAYRVAARVRTNRMRRDRRETADGLDSAASPATTAGSNAVTLHEEVDRLPEHLRRPLVYCYLEGLTHDRAAERLGCPVGTVRSRLARARALLHRRLSARGVAPSVVPLEIVATWRRSLDPPARLVQRTLRLAVVVRSSWSEAGFASASLLSLVNGVVRMMKLKKVVVALSVLTPLGGVAAVCAAQAYHRPADDLVASVPQASELKTYAATYYVGDLLGVGAEELSKSRKEGERFRSTVDLLPIVNLIKRTVERGSWKEDRVAPPGGDPEGGSDRDEERRPGSITPFYLSLSVIVRHTPQAHEQIADLLRNVRAVVNPAVSRASGMAVERVDAPLKPPADPTSRRGRVASLLKMLQSEMKAYEKELADAEPDAEAK